MSVGTPEPQTSYNKGAFDSLTASIAVLDRSGTVLEANRAWRALSTAIGSNFLAQCDHAAAAGDATASATAAGIRAVLSGACEEFEAVYPSHSSTEKRWYQLTVNRLLHVKGCVVLAYNNVTSLKLVQEALQLEQHNGQAIASTLVEKERFIKRIADHLPGMVAYWDKNLRCKFSNHAYLEWFGKTPQQMDGIRLQDLLSPQLFALNEPYIRQVLAGKPQYFERTLTKADASIGYTLASYIPDVNAQGEVDGFFVLVSDVTPVKKAEFELKLAASVYQNTLEGIFVTDADGTIISVNPAFAQITGYTAQEAIGKNPRILKSGLHDRAFYENIWHHLNTRGHWHGEIWNRRKSGELMLALQTISRIANAPDAPARYLSVLSDITEMWQKNEKIRHQAFFDTLTDLPNRALLMDRLERHIASCKRDNRSFALLFLDLDQFKRVNDHYGHHIGDDLLQAVSKKFQAQVRESDTLARIGGDEFVVLLDEPASRDEIVHIATRIIASIQEPMVLRDQVTEVGVSIGVAIYPADGSTPSQLLKSADTAMYAAKQSGKNTYRFSDGANAVAAKA